jgi:carbamoyl-phosphate synthase small subunit
MASVMGIFLLFKEGTMDRKLVLENGKIYLGKGFGAAVESIAEIVFNTSMVGYQEILSDPSYNGQIITMTYPLIGNYGINEDDFETKVPSMSGFIVREYNDEPSNFRYTKTLSEVLKEYSIPGISGIDTREVTRIIRNEGSMKVMITDASVSDEDALKRLRETTLREDQVRQVTCKKPWMSRTTNPRFNVVAIDCGIKLNIVRKLNEKGCNVTIVPFDTPAEQIMKYKPDGLFLSNGPGNPESVPEVIEVVKETQGKLPIFGICLGHQLISLANGASTYKMKFGHRGGNHPVKNLSTGKIEITSQNHSYAVELESLRSTKLTETHHNILDDTIEGVENKDEFIFSVQYHPESAPGPQDSDYLFDVFIDNMTRFNKEEN